MKIHVLPSGPIQTIGYLLTDAQLGEAVLIDAPGDIVKRIQPILAKESVKLTEHWITHGHWDHMQESAKVKREFGARVIAHKADQALLETPEVMEARMGRSMGLEPVAVDAWVEQGEVLKALGREFEVRHVPGHCPGNILFYLPASAEASARQGGVAFVGDALFNRGVGRWDFPGGNFNELAKSIRTQIYTLPDETIVFPGHGERTTVGEEKAENPYVSAKE